MKHILIGRKITRKTRIRLHRGLRFLIQLFFLLTFPSAFTAAFAGLRYILLQLGSQAPIEMTPFLMILLGLCGYTILFGRFFCGYACAFGSFGDWIHDLWTWLFQKIFHKRAPSLPQRLTVPMNNIKYLVLLVILFLCYRGSYGDTRGSSPWDAFSRLATLLPGIHLHEPMASAFTLGSFRQDLLTGYRVGCILLVLILIGMCLQERFFCRFLCPMGAVFALLPVVPMMNLRRKTETCSAKCNLCRMDCPTGVILPDHTQPEIQGDCIQCQKCSVTCPKNNINTGIHKISGNNRILTLIKAVLLILLLYRLNL